MYEKKRDEQKQPTGIHAWGSHANQVILCFPTLPNLKKKNAFEAGWQLQKKTSMI